VFEISTFSQCDTFTHGPAESIRTHVRNLYKLKDIARYDSTYTYGSVQNLSCTTQNDRTGWGSWSTVSAD